VRRPLERSTISDDGVLADALQVTSPNYDLRPEGEAINLLVIHGISLPPGQFEGDAILRFFTNRLDYSEHPYYETLRDVRVSAHFLIRRDGELIQLVACCNRAWHAGVSSWKGRERCNDFSIGVELEGTDELPYTDAQYQRLSDLTAVLRRRYPIADVVGHADIAPGRKTDPGQAFDWARFRLLLSGLS
jgi:AmpD protein